MAGGMPVQIGSAASVILGAAKSPAVGATVVQLGGTDRAPTAPALPRLADTLAAGSMWPASTPAPEPTAPVATNPDPAAAATGSHHRGLRRRAHETQHKIHEPLGCTDNAGSPGRESRVRGQAAQ